MAAAGAALGEGGQEREGELECGHAVQRPPVRRRNWQRREGRKVAAEGGRCIEGAWAWEYAAQNCRRRIAGEGEHDGIGQSAESFLD